MTTITKGMSSLALNFSTTYCSKPNATSVCNFTIIGIVLAILFYENGMGIVRNFSQTVRALSLLPNTLLQHVIKPILALPLESRIFLGFGVVVFGGVGMIKRKAFLEPSWPLKGNILGWRHWQRIELTDEKAFRSFRKSGGCQQCIEFIEGRCTYTALQDTSTGLVFTMTNAFWSVVYRLFTHFL